MWKPLKMSEDLEKAVMAVFRADYETRLKKYPKTTGSWEDFLEVQGLSHKDRWHAAQNDKKAGRLLSIGGIAEGTSVILIYEGGPSGKLLGSYSEHHGEDRGPNRRARIVKLLGKKGLTLL